MRDEDTARTLAALSEPSRRAMLDALCARDGQSVTELADAVPDLGRHAVLKHVRALEASGLITTTKLARTRLCYLNPTPIVVLAQRWLDEYGATWGTALTSLAHHAGPASHPKEPDMSTIPSHSPLSPAATDPGRRPDHRHSVVVDTEPAAVWRALVEDDAAWYFGTTLVTEREAGLPVPGREYRYLHPDGTAAAEGIIIAVEEEHLLEMTFSPVWDDAVRDEAPVRLAWLIERVGGRTMVTVEHYDVIPGSATGDQMDGGSLYLVSNLKTYLETGAGMTR